MLPCTAVLLALSACAAQPEGPPTIALRSSATEYFVSEYGVRVGIRVDFPQDRTVTGARLVWSGGSDEISPYPLDGTDPDVPLETLELAAGTAVLLEGNVVAPCPSAPDVPIFEVDSLLEGNERTDRYRPGDPGGFDKAFFEWCERPTTMNVRGSQITPQGRYELYLQFSNPGPGTVTIESRAVTRGASRWRPAQLDVPAGAVEQMTVVGHGPPECMATPPWVTGDVLANGTPIKPADGEFC